MVHINFPQAICLNIYTKVQKKLRQEKPDFIFRFLIFIQPEKNKTHLIATTTTLPTCHIIQIAAGMTW
jgi:hypothetical protein